MPALPPCGCPVCGSALLANWRRDTFVCKQARHWQTRSASDAADFARCRQRRLGMIPVSDELIARIGKVNVRFGALLQTMGSALAAAAGQDGGEEWDVAELRDFAHQLVALGG